MSIEQTKSDIEQDTVTMGLIDTNFTSVCISWIPINKYDLPKVGDSYFTTGHMESGKGRFYYIEGIIKQVGAIDNNFVEVYIELTQESKASYWGFQNTVSDLLKQKEDEYVESMNLLTLEKNELQMYRDQLQEENDKLSKFNDNLLGQLHSLECERELLRDQLSQSFTVEEVMQLFDESVKFQLSEGNTTPSYLEFSATLQAMLNEEIKDRKEGKV